MVQWGEVMACGTSPPGQREWYSEVRWWHVAPHHRDTEKGTVRWGDGMSHRTTGTQRIVQWGDGKSNKLANVWKTGTEWWLKKLLREIKKILIFFFQWQKNNNEKTTERTTYVVLHCCGIKSSSGEAGATSVLMPFPHFMARIWRQHLELSK